MSDVKDTHRVETPSSKTQALAKSMNMDIWVVGTSNQLFIRGSYGQATSSKKKKVVTMKTLFFLIVRFYTPYSICLNNGFRQGSYAWKCCVVNLSSFK